MSQHLPIDAAARKAIPLASGVLDYFPDALLAVAELSKKGNDQHNPGQPLHWSRGKSNDHPDCLMRHLVDRGAVDTDGVRHSAKVAWRALAILQLEIEAGTQDNILAPVVGPAPGQEWEFGKNEGWKCNAIRPLWAADGVLVDWRNPDDVNDYGTDPSQELGWYYSRQYRKHQ